MTYHLRAQHARLADFLKSKQAKVIDDVPARVAETLGSVDKALSLVQAELPSMQGYPIHGVLI